MQANATNDTLTRIPAALHGVACKWRKQSDPPWLYSKASIVTTDLVQLAGSQQALIGKLDCERLACLMGPLDTCNAHWGRGAAVPARAGLERQRRGWATKFEMRTPRYTTQVDELPSGVGRRLLASGRSTASRNATPVGSLASTATLNATCPRSPHPRKPSGYDDLVWPDPIGGGATAEVVAATFRRNMARRPKDRLAKVARLVGWTFSDYRPDETVIYLGS